MSFHPLRLVLLLGPMWALAAAPPTTGDVRKLVAEVRYDDARRMLERLQAIEGQPLATTLELLELQGIVAGALKQPDKARTAFKKLLSLKPDAHLSADFAPRITTPFFEAKGWLTAQAPLRFTRVAPTIEAGRVAKVTVLVADDQLGLARKIRVFTKVGEAPARVVEQPSSAEVSVAVSAPEVRWWAQLIGEREAVIAEAGSATEPFIETAKVDAPIIAVVPNAVPTTGSPLRIASYVSAGLGVASMATGAIFGVLASGARSQFNSATNGAQVVTTITRAKALQLDADARGQAFAANVFFVAGAALIITGVVLWLLGAPAPEPAS